MEGIWVIDVENLRTDCWLLFISYVALDKVYSLSLSIFIINVGKRIISVS